MKKASSTPKVKVSAIIFSNMMKYVYLNQLTDEQFAEAMEVTTRTLLNYKEKPNSMTIERLEIFLENMGMDIQSLLTI